MSLLKPIENGRMYPGWHRWNPIGGCEHGCTYCSIKRVEKRAGNDMTTPVFRNGENGTKNYLKDNLGSGRRIFVCSSGDMWGEWVTPSWILKVLKHCAKYPENEYMFLTKNPAKYLEFQDLNRSNYILGATIEGFIWDCMANSTTAPSFGERAYAMQQVKNKYPKVRIMISAEPIVGHLRDYADMLRRIAPHTVWIGADSGKNGLPEPSADDLRELIAELRTFTDVRLKKGLDRLLAPAVTS